MQLFFPLLKEEVSTLWS